MPRPRTRGDRIQINLPLDVDAAVRSVAEQAGVPPSAIVVDTITEAFRDPPSEIPDTA